MLGELSRIVEKCVAGHMEVIKAEAMHFMSILLAASVDEDNKQLSTTLNMATTSVFTFHKPLQSSNSICLGCAI